MPRSSRVHSAAEITLGTRSSGNGRSWPDSEKVMPWSVKARPSASARASRSEASDGDSSAKMPLYRLDVRLLLRDGRDVSAGKVRRLTHHMLQHFGRFGRPLGLTLGELG